MTSQIALYDKLNNELKIVIDIKTDTTYASSNEGKPYLLYSDTLKEKAKQELIYKLSLILECDFELVIIYSDYNDTYMP